MTNEERTYADRLREEKNRETIGNYLPSTNFIERINNLLKKKEDLDISHTGKSPLTPFLKKYSTDRETAIRYYENSLKDLVEIEAPDYTSPQDYPNSLYYYDPNLQYILILSKDNERLVTASYTPRKYIHFKDPEDQEKYNPKNRPAKSQTFTVKDKNKDRAETTDGETPSAREKPADSPSARKEEKKDRETVSLSDIPRNTINQMIQTVDSGRTQIIRAAKGKIVQTFDQMENDPSLSTEDAVSRIQDILDEMTRTMDENRTLNDLVTRLKDSEAAKTAEGTEDPNA